LVQAILVQTTGPVRKNNKNAEQTLDMNEMLHNMWAVMDSALRGTVVCTAVLPEPGSLVNARDYLVALHFG
jgi:hypothetical protein